MRIDFSILTQKKLKNMKVLLKILDNIQYLGRQRIAFCGHDEIIIFSCICHNLLNRSFLCLKM